MNFDIIKFQIWCISKFLVTNVLFLTTKKSLKFYFKMDIGIFLGYSSTSKTYRVFNMRTLVIEESMHVVFDISCNDISNEYL